jgi:hypothetical protein
MDRIDGQVKDRAERGKQTISWIVDCGLSTKRALMAVQLQEALGVEIGESDLDRENMVSACAGLVTVDEGSQIVRLVHYTTQ